VIVENRATSQEVKKTNLGIGHEPKEKIKGKEKEEEPAGVEDHLKIHVNKFGGRKVPGEKEDRQEQQE
jgi:hypothetical protein